MSATGKGRSEPLPRSQKRLLLAVILCVLGLGALGIMAAIMGENPAEQEGQSGAVVPPQDSCPAAQLIAGWQVVQHAQPVFSLAYDYGVAVTGVGNSIYVANSNKNGTSNRLIRYSTTSGTWDTVGGSPPQHFKNGTAMTSDGVRYLYVLFGASYEDVERGGRRFFYRFDTVTLDWTRLQDTPRTQGPGDAVAYVRGGTTSSEGDYVYAILGSNKRSGSGFYRYDLRSNTWSSPLAFRWDSTDDGASLVWAGGTYLYALRGEWQETTPCYDFARYDLRTGTWQARAPIPAWPYSDGIRMGSGGVGDGGSLVWLGWLGEQYADYLLALNGNQADPEEWKRGGPIFDGRVFLYSMSADCWRRPGDLPPGLGVGDQNGSRLGIAGGGVYLWRGCRGNGTLLRLGLFGRPVSSD